MDLNAARELFETSQDLTVGIEEEWAIIDPQTLELVPKYEALRADGDQDDVLRHAISGELISTRDRDPLGRGEDVQHALAAAARGAPAAVRARRQARRGAGRAPARTR